MLGTMSAEQVLTIDGSTTKHNDSCDRDHTLDRPLMNDSTVAAVGERSRVEYQPVILLVGDFRVRLFPRYRRGKRMFYGADPETVNNTTGCRCDIDGATAAGTMLLSSSNFSLVIGENPDDDNRHATATSGECQTICDASIDNRVSPSLVRHQSINGDIARKNRHSECFRTLLTADNQVDLDEESMADRKESATSRQDSDMHHRNAAFLTCRSVTTNEITEEDIELLQRSPEFVTGGSRLLNGDSRTMSAPPTTETNDRHVQPSFDIDQPPGYPACFSETEPDDEDICRGKPLLRNDVTSSEAETSLDDRSCRKQVTHVGRRRRMTIAISRRLKLDSAAVRRRCDPYEVSRKMLGFLASTVGLTCLLVGYTALGGWLFVRLEGKNAGRIQSSMRTTRSQYIEKLWVMTEKLNVLHHDNWTQEAECILDAYAEQVYMATKRLGWDGTNKDEDEGKTGADDEISEQWSYAGALLFSITVITTIG